MTSATFIFFLAVFIGGGILGVFLMLLVGIHAEERRMSLTGSARSRTTASTRRFLGVSVRAHSSTDTRHSLTR